LIAGGVFGYRYHAKQFHVPAEVAFGYFGVVILQETPGLGQEGKPADLCGGKGLYLFIDGFAEGWDVLDGISIGQEGEIVEPHGLFSCIYCCNAQVVEGETEFTGIEFTGIQYPACGVLDLETGRFILFFSPVLAEEEADGAATFAFQFSIKGKTQLFAGNVDGNAVYKLSICPVGGIGGIPDAYGVAAVLTGGAVGQDLVFFFVKEGFVPGAEGLVLGVELFKIQVPGGFLGGGSPGN